MALHPHSTDRAHFPDGLASYIKGLAQTNGIPGAASYAAFLKACGIGPGPMPGHFEDPAIAVNGPALLNGPLGAFTRQLVGPDSDAYGAPEVPAAPALDSVEYAIELVECYWAAVLRDTPFTSFAGDPVAQQAAAEMTALAQAHPGAYKGPVTGANVVTPELLFRGGLKANGKTYFAGEDIGPYVSQFMLLPATLGALALEQKMRARITHRDYMTDFAEWNAIQNGKAPTPPQQPEFGPDRYYTTGRDGGSYTQVDELYQAYLIAYLLCGPLGIKRNPGTHYSAASANPYKRQKPFGNFGGPDISATIGAVARAAIDAVWYQKWAVHLRHRPEVGGGIVHMLKNGLLPAVDAAKLGNFNLVLNSHALQASAARHGGSVLLPQAFPEGSPTHPAYPTGHGAVAGACITVLKYFFDCSGLFPTTATIHGAPMALPLVPTVDGQALVSGAAAPLTVNGELHKLAHNVSFGHGTLAGIHWRSDTDWSITLGEAVAIKYLEQQTKTYPEAVNITITKVDGTPHTFSKPGL